MMKKILVIEDDDFAFRSIKLQLKKIGYPADSILRCTQLSDIDNIDAEVFEIVLTDLTLPGSECRDTFKKVKKKFPFTPIVVFTGTAEKEVAVNTIQQGAQDYLVKGEFNQKILEKTIQYAIERNKVLDRIFLEKQNLRAMINNTKDIIWSINKDHKIISANNSYWARVKKISGKGKDQVSIADFDKELADTWIGFYEQALKGRKTYEEVRFNLIHNKDNNIIGVSCFSRDITKQYTHLKMIKKQNDQLRQIASIHSHDVRGPVATILGIAHLFNLEDPGNPENIEILENIKVAANKLDDIIKIINAHTTTNFTT